jgi:translation initiation factor IF-2
VDLTVVEAGVGQITISDIHLADASNAVIVGFNTKLESGAQAGAKHYGVRILQHNIIYELINQVKDVMRELLDPEWIENKLGSAEVRKIFTISKRHVAGCMVIGGKISNNTFARLIRKGQILSDAKITALKRFKDDVFEVKSGYECGIELGSLSEPLMEGDVIECYEKVSKFPDL